MRTLRQRGQRSLNIDELVCWEMGWQSAILEDNENKVEVSSFTLVVNNPWSFTATTGDFWIPKLYGQAMKRLDLWVSPMEIEYRTLLEKECFNRFASRARVVGLGRI